jgi:ABC-2 type transport system ATP-binding protein
MEINPVVQVDALAFHFDTRTVFGGFSARIEPGITWLRGPNGRGKTTLLRLLAGALAPSGGTIRLGELDCVRDPFRYRLDSFYCGAELPQLPWLTVREWLDLHLALYPAARSEDVGRQLDGFGVADTLPQALSTLSLGQHKKVQLALALALPVRLLLLDEPFNGLDAEARARLRAQLGARALARATCVILTSHLDPQLELAGTLDLAAPATRV